MSALERAARAAALRYGFSEQEWEALPDVNPVANGEWDKREFREMARAALTAIREPSEGMVEAAQLNHRPETTYRTAWQTMIDAVLAEGT